MVYFEKTVLWQLFWLSCNWCHHITSSLIQRPSVRRGAWTRLQSSSLGQLQEMTWSGEEAGASLEELPRPSKSHGLLTWGCPLKEVVSYSVVRNHEMLVDGFRKLSNERKLNMTYRIVLIIFQSINKVVNPPKSSVLVHSQSTSFRVT